MIIVEVELPVGLTEGEGHVLDLIFVVIDGVIAPIVWTPIVIFPDAVDDSEELTPGDLLFVFDEDGVADIVMETDEDTNAL